MMGASKPNGGTSWRDPTYLGTDNGQRILVCAFSIIATVVLVLAPGTAAAYAFGIPFIFFIPGYVVVRMFFWKGSSPETKFTLSLGLSILVVIFLGIVLVTTPIGLNSDTTRASLIVFSLGGVAVETLWLRADRQVKSTEDKKEVPKEPVKIDKVVAAMLATALVVSGVSLGLIVTAEYPSRTYFAVTGTDGMVITNPTYEVGTNLTVVVEMKNGEDGPRNFTLVTYGPYVTGSGVQNFSKVLDRNEGWDVLVTFNFTAAGNSRLNFDLYIQDDEKPPILYGNLHIWISVTEPEL